MLRLSTTRRAYYGIHRKMSPLGINMYHRLNNVTPPDGFNLTAVVILRRLFLSLSLTHIVSALK